MTSTFGIFLVTISVLYGTTFAAGPCRLTRADIEGPYYIKGAPAKQDSVLCDLVQSGNGTKMIVKGRVTSDDCQSGVQAHLDVWQANSNGKYALAPGDYHCRGKFTTDPQGYYQIETVIPGYYLDGSAFRPAHIHWKITALNEPDVTLTTQLYFQHDPYLADKDPCSPYCHSGDPTITEEEVKTDKNTVTVQWDVVLRQNHQGKYAA